MFKFFKGKVEGVKSALKNTRAFLGNGIRDLFQGKIDEEALEELEELLYRADLGAQTAAELTDHVRNRLRGKTDGAKEVLDDLEEQIAGMLGQYPTALHVSDDGPTVILVVGVNGNGKTTSIAKLAHRLQQEGKSVVLGAADTFRAGAIDQLGIWADKLGCPLVRSQSGADPASVVYDTIASAKAKGADYVLIDTAGRLHTKIDLMDELKKVCKVSDKLIPGSPHETLLVIDATTGQNAVEQAKIFHDYTPITGVILTKLDGTAKGGIVVAIERTLSVPVKLIGVGEKIDDLYPFEPKAFAQSLFR